MGLLDDNNLSDSGKRNWPFHLRKRSRRSSLLDSLEFSGSDSDGYIPLQTIRRRHSGITPKPKPASNNNHRALSPPSSKFRTVTSSAAPVLSPSLYTIAPSVPRRPEIVFRGASIAPKTRNSNDHSVSEAQSAESIRIGDYSVAIGPVIGSGGFSSVYAVTDNATKRKYALKVVQVTSSVQEELRTNLLEEVKILESLAQVDNVIQLLAHAAAPDQDETYMLMELGQGDLRQILHSSSEGASPLDIDFVRYWGGQILKAVNAVHLRNIVHADLKPANFIVVNGVLKLCDFGIANPVPDNTVSIRRNNAIGTLLYMAPETLKQTAIDSTFKVTKASDMWSCGIILYEMVYQSYPFSDRTYLSKAENSELEEVQHPKVTPANSPVPLALHEVIRDCLNLDVAKRIMASEAVRSVFFSPVSVDLQAVLSITRNAYRYGHQVATNNQKVQPERLEELARVLYQRLIRFNSGEF